MKAWRCPWKQFVNLCHPKVTHECPKKISAHSVQPFGRLYATHIYIDIYIRMSCFIIQIYLKRGGIIGNIRF